MTKYITTHELLSTLKTEVLCTWVAADFLFAFYIIYFMEYFMHTWNDVDEILKRNYS